jgi:hypothetical protein
MVRGDQIYVMRPLVGMEGVYEHHGIDCGDGTVIHYRKGDEAVVSRTSMESFARGNPVFVKSQPVGYVPDLVIERAESRLGERRYDLLTNNCEHFANWCKTGRNESQQILNYGLDLKLLNAFNTRGLMQHTAEENDPATAIALFNQALSNVAAAQSRIQTQYDQAQHDVMTWHRVAQLALSKNREDLARAALERKVNAKHRANDLLEQLAQLAETQANLDRNQQILQRRIITS